MLRKFYGCSLFYSVHTRFSTDFDALSDQLVCRFIELCLEEHNRCTSDKIGYNWHGSEGMKWFRKSIEFGIKRLAVKFSIEK